MSAPASLLSDQVLSWADRHRHKLFAGLLVIYLLGFNAQWRIEPDSALYLTIGRNLAEGHGYTFHGQRHHLAFPGLPLLFSAVFKLFGTKTLVPSLVVMLLIGAATLALSYRLFLLRAGRPTAVLMTFGLGISRLFYRYCFELLSDMPFLLGVMAFLAGFEAVFYRGAAAQEKGRRAEPARWFDWLLLVSGLLLAVAMRPSMWALLAAVVLALAWSAIRSPARRVQSIVCIAAVVVAGVVFWWIDPRRGGASMGDYEDTLFNITSAHLESVLHNVLPNIGKFFEATLSQALFGARLGPGLSSIAGAAIILVCFTMLLDRPLWFLWVAMTFLMMIIAIEPLDRYFLEVLPLMIFAWWRGIRWVNLRLAGRSPRWADWIFAALFLLGGATNLMRVGEFVVEQRHSHFLYSYKDGRYASINRVAKMLHDRVDEKSWAITTAKFSRTLTFLSHRTIIGPREPLPSADMPAGYVLDPIDDLVRQRLNELGLSQGPQVGAEIQSRFDPEPWRLRRAVPQQ